MFGNFKKLSLDHFEKMHIGEHGSFLCILGIFGRCIPPFLGRN